MIMFKNQAKGYPDQMCSFMQSHCEEMYKRVAENLDVYGKEVARVEGKNVVDAMEASMGMVDVKTAELDTAFLQLKKNQLADLKKIAA